MYNYGGKYYDEAKNRIVNENLKLIEHLEQTIEDAKVAVAKEKLELSLLQTIKFYDATRECSNTDSVEDQYYDEKSKSFNAKYDELREIVNKATRSIEMARRIIEATPNL